MQIQTMKWNLTSLKRRYDGLHRDMYTIAAREVPMGLPVAEFAAAAIAEALAGLAEPTAYPDPAALGNSVIRAAYEILHGCTLKPEISQHLDVKTVASVAQRLNDHLPAETLEADSHEWVMFDAHDGGFVHLSQVPGAR
ncbi:hypothetical protein H8F21_14400 [Pseudomonas sp. P66]|uniref:Uncharacterized protein n=1 Tax=Pseudomonas arcuscaelestis TaxID=2710591 RepID=A0ABS2BZ44_9PSED|nr:hypothetical protein [Pseudomonas arcuscaelestis]MBM5458755.1 hypothetical protein [Pseudomonas arcuscaelestis]